MVLLSTSVYIGLIYSDMPKAMLKSAVRDYVACMIVCNMKSCNPEKEKTSSMVSTYGSDAVRCDSCRLGSVHQGQTDRLGNVSPDA